MEASHAGSEVDVSLPENDVEEDEAEDDEEEDGDDDDDDDEDDDENEDDDEEEGEEETEPAPKIALPNRSTRGKRMAQVKYY